MRFFISTGRIKPQNLNINPFYIVNNGGVRLDVQSTIDRIKAKQVALKHLKINNSIKTQSELDKYIDSLSKEHKCKHMTGIPELINLCNINLNCKFKGETYKSFTKNPKKECLRERIVRFERILEH